MWVFLNNAFLSIVDKAEDKSKLVVRARRKGHIEAVFPGVMVTRNPSGDYLYRAFIDREAVAAAMQQAVMGITYPNFKNSIKDNVHHNAAHKVWDVMAKTQEVPPYSGGFASGYGRGTRKAAK